MSLLDKTLVMLVAPSAMGKSTIMNEVTTIDSHFGYVKSFTTRDRRPGETAHYDFISRTEALRLHDQEQTITYFEHPTTHDLYGTTAASFGASYNLLDTLSGSVNLYCTLPFAKTITISMTTPPELWRERFLMRYPKPSSEATKRLEEAVISINWSLGDQSTKWLINDDTPEDIAKKLIAIVRGELPTDDGETIAHAILDLIEKGAVYA